MYLEETVLVRRPPTSAGGARTVPGSPGEPRGAQGSPGEPRGAQGAELLEKIHGDFLQVSKKSDSSKACKTIQ